MEIIFVCSSSLPLLATDLLFNLRKIECLLSSFLTVVSWGISVESAFHSHTLKWVAPALLLALLCSALNLAATCWHYGERCDILAVRLLSLPRTPILRLVHLEKTITRLSSAALAAYSFFTLGALMTKKDQGKDFFGVLRENSFTSAV